MIGLMLHTNAKQLIKAQNYQDALEVLSMGEEAFSLCDQKVIELVIDNLLYSKPIWFGVISCLETSTGSQWQEFALRKPEKVLNEQERTLLVFDSFRQVAISECTIFETGACWKGGGWRITMVRLISQ
ncbi:hypothetical protein RchiOBHm_Chr5g0069491 [Rosa chinensis]|uniref:Uncharacterized protein n=1 Tax=Rosa chinensis TaxID=74649 RepID=A0A2P6QJY4_ROSCH|nr:uncharacterized protein LOC112202738 [Rosa chinensis]PRQ34488.1 hypothetical protein RchiOBHm_Chr5g0069491 [Rosa chinensis]